MALTEAGEMKGLLTLSGCALALALAGPASAQEPARLPFGARVRLTWRDSSARYVGEVRAVLDDTLVVADSAGAPDLLVPLTRLRSVEVYRGRAAGWAWTALGVVAGAAAGGWLGYHLWRPDAEVEGEDLLDVLVNLTIQSGPTATAVLGGLLGSALLGSLGHMADRRERWESFRPERLRLGAVPLPRGRLGIGAAFRF